MLNTQSSGGVVLNDQGQVLVVSQHGTSWSLPKGHIEDKGKDKLAAAKREIYEETGLKDVTLIKELGSYQRYKIALDGGDDKSELKTIYMFLFKTDQTNLKPVDPENPEAKWINKQDVAGLLTHKNDQAFFLSIIDQI